MLCCNIILNSNVALPGNAEWFGLPKSGQIRLLEKEKQNGISKD